MASIAVVAPHSHVKLDASGAGAVPQAHLGLSQAVVGRPAAAVALASSTSASATVAGHQHGSMFLLLDGGGDLGDEQAAASSAQKLHPPSSSSSTLASFLALRRDTSGEDPSRSAAFASSGRRGSYLTDLHGGAAASADSATSCPASSSSSTSPCVASSPTSTLACRKRWLSTSFFNSVAGPVPPYGLDDDESNTSCFDCACSILDVNRKPPSPRIVVPNVPHHEWIGHYTDRGVSPKLLIALWVIGATAGWALMRGVEGLVVKPPGKSSRVEGTGAAAAAGSTVSEEEDDEDMEDEEEELVDDDDEEETEEEEEEDDADDEDG